MQDVSPGCKYCIQLALIQVLQVMSSYNKSYHLDPMDFLGTRLFLGCFILLSLFTL